MARMIFENNKWHLRDDWYIDDVRLTIDCENLEDADDFTDADCARVLEVVITEYDAAVGINWDSMRDAIETIVIEKRLSCT